MCALSQDDGPPTSSATQFGLLLVREYDAPDRPGIPSPPELGTLLAALPEQP